MYSTKIKQRLKARNTLIATHRGSYGGNIIQNSLAAYKAALKQYTDVIELDVAMSQDDVLYCFHTNVEQSIGFDKKISEMTSTEIDNYNCTNILGKHSGMTIPRLETVLNEFKDKCFINVDRAWFYWEQTIKLIDKLQAHEYVILKSPVKPELLKQLADSNTNIMYMPIIYNIEEVEIVKQYNVNLLGVELIFDTLDHHLVNPQTMQNFKDAGILMWVNAIELGEKHQLSGGLTDTKSITISEDDNWGKLVEMGFDIIQTDWPGILSNYLISK
ncbi:MAG: hypothetical protein ATN35_02525 [Epulopiscium sp. Nele67-Bin004]|nr:MAG: hypothetical protein ATN35_02525 [Epulopiscium sp. Nele67-Bin004]